MKILVLACFIVGFCSVLGSNITEDDAVRVTTPLGEIEGFKSKLQDVPVKTFLGIPYATPPLGNLRFLRPKPVQPWNDTLQAKHQPPACMQLHGSRLPSENKSELESEDCLYLNIFTPFYATNESKLAVLFWMYGGKFNVGSIGIELYDGSTLAGREGVIVVTVNYRLNMFGFLASNTSDAPGNAGLYDLVEALKWVNDNIEYFGGDKTRITIFGQSAGAIAASMLCVSPLTEGLFSRAILQSGSITSIDMNSLNNMDLAQILAKAVECATDERTIQNNTAEVVQCLKEKNATHLSQALKSIFKISRRSFTPQYGDTLLPNNGTEEVRNGNFHNVSILTGVVTDEGSFIATMLFSDEFGDYGENGAVVNKTFATSAIQKVFGNIPNAQKYIDHYLKDVADDDNDLLRKQIHTALGDLTFVCPTLYFAEKFAENKDVYYYKFNHRPSNTPWAEWMGVVHCDEVQFVFGQPLRVPGNYTAEEVELSVQVMKMWANFAKDGHPGKLCSDVLVEWPKFSKENPVILNIDTTHFGTLVRAPHQESCNLLRENYGI